MKWEHDRVEDTESTRLAERPVEKVSKSRSVLINSARASWKSVVHRETVGKVGKSIVENQYSSLDTRYRNSKDNGTKITKYFVL